MNIALVSEHASPLAALGSVDAGGQNVHVAALASALARAGHGVVVYTRRDDPSLPRSVPLVPGARVAHVDAGPARPVAKDDLWPFMPAFAEGLEAAWQRQPPDIVHSHFWMSGWAAQEAAARLGVPVAHTFHALGITKQRHQGSHDTSPKARIRVEADLACSCDRILATSNEELFELSRMGASPARLTLVPCGVDVGHFRPATASPPEHPRDGRPPRVVVVSRLVERKGIDDVIVAMRGVPSAELVVAGGPHSSALDRDPEACRLLGVARSHGVSDRVRLIGRVERPDLPALYRSASAVVCTPWYEPFGLVALEAMACGAPVVASAVGGLVDTVLDGVTGSHVPAHSPDAIAGALQRILRDPAAAAALGAAGAARAHHRYAWDTIAAETARAYAASGVGAVRSRVG